MTPDPDWDEGITVFDDGLVITMTFTVERSTQIRAAAQHHRTPVNRFLNRAATSHINRLDGAERAERRQREGRVLAPRESKTRLVTEWRH